MKKWFLSFILFITMLFAPLSGVMAAADGASLQVGSYTGYRGQSVDVTVSISNVEDFCLISLTPTYDTSAFTLQSASSSYNLTTGGKTLVESKTDGDGITAGVLVTYTFAVASNAELGDYTIQVSVGKCVKWDMSTISVSSATGTVTVTDYVAPPYTPPTPVCSHTAAAEYSTNATYHWNVCTKCGVALKVYKHQFGEGVVTKEATETEEGVMTYACIACKYEKTEVIEKLPPHEHNYTNKNDKTNHWSECTICGEKKDVTAHTFVNGTCSCGQKEEVKHTHSYTTKYDENNHWSECSCGDKKDVVAHDFVKGVCACGCEKEGMSTGAVVGIVIGSTAVAGAGGFSVVWFVVMKKTGAELVVASKAVLTTAVEAVKSGVLAAIKAIKSLFVK